MKKKPNKALPELPEDSTYEKILAYLFDESGKLKLSDKSAELFERYKCADDLFRKYGADFKVVRALVKKYSLDSEYSERTAYRDLRNAKKLFGTTCKLDKEYCRIKLYEWCANAAEECQKIGDYKAHVKYIDQMRKLARLDIDETEMPEWDKMLNVQIIITGDPTEIGREKYDIAALEQKYAQKKKSIELKEQEDGNFSG